MKAVLPQTTIAKARAVGRYTIHDEIAAGGMGTVHIGRLMGAAGFARTVAIKRMHSELAKDPEFVSMFVDEARIAACIHHPNVVATLDVVASAGELFTVMEYVHGESLSWFTNIARRLGGRIPLPVALRIACDVLSGLHAAHEATGEDGKPLELVHRDVSPQNILVGVQGSSRILDFGVAKAVGRLQTTRDGQLKGKIAYMSPEQILGRPVDRRSDVYSASVVIWELLTGVRLFNADNHAAIMQRVLNATVQPPSEVAAELPSALDGVVMRGLARRAYDRHSSAHEMEAALRAASVPATTAEVSEWVKDLAGDGLRTRSAKLAEIETSNTANTEVSDPWGLVETGTDNPAHAGARLVVKEVSRPPREPTSTTTKTDGSMSSSPSPAPSNTAQRTFWVPVGIMLVAGAAAVAYARSVSPAAQHEPLALSARATAGASPASSAGASPASSADASPASSASAAAPPADSRTPSVPGEISSVRTPASVRPGPPAATKATAAKARPALDCNPPYVVDSIGIRSFKRECVTEPLRVPAPSGP